MKLILLFTLPIWLPIFSIALLKLFDLLLDPSQKGLINPKILDFLDDIWWELTHSDCGCEDDGPDYCGYSNALDDGPVYGSNGQKIGDVNWGHYQGSGSVYSGKTYDGKGRQTGEIGSWGNLRLK
ncbi:hypothetical protein A2V71_00850 [Candidatus Berkelbacteria bacterium RBG_13_40_8]|uniref:Uncharacterized protein n=1 Tax=Candidatus Berkelbacteria bacterium RBG_13_40_8 TaxID=1797467 RepID=A0A1F5DQQ3_9BACT|nr:MAG: hypothetical protein A2V71_00850 [Candidatus Berkelbacteria bacterium RBG_13_40_8]